MTQTSRRKLLRLAAAGVLSSAFPDSIRRALAVPAQRATGTLDDVQHVVILMQENRSFDHYFGTLPGVRGFGDRFTVPQRDGRTVWQQSDGHREILPFHLDTRVTKGMRVPMTPHAWPDAQSAWNHGRIDQWPRFKEFASMGYYRGRDIPFQFALANAFTLCDAHHCSIQTGTTPNRMVFMCGTNFDPANKGPADDQARAMIDNSNNLGQTRGLYAWTTYPERLEAAGVSWRIYQNKTSLDDNPSPPTTIGPLDNWGGLCAPWESFRQYRQAGPGHPLHEKAMRAWSLDDLRRDVLAGSLPQVSWLVPPPNWSEHPYASSPVQGAAYVQKVLDALTANPEVWSKTVFIITFDENDGLFDHVPPPAVPSLEDDGTPAGATTLEAGHIAQQYFRNDINGVTHTRPYGMGPRVPMYVISPWSAGGWVNSQVFDHTSVIRFLERRFGVAEPNIPAWHRAVSGDLLSCFDFSREQAAPPARMPELDVVTGRIMVMPASLKDVAVPSPQRMPVQPAGLRKSRALPYELDVRLEKQDNQKVRLEFSNTGTVGAVFHVYDKLALERLPRRYTVEHGKRLSADWALHEGTSCALFVLGPNGFHREFRGDGLHRAAQKSPLIKLAYQPQDGRIDITLTNPTTEAMQLLVEDHSYDRKAEPLKVQLPPKGIRILPWSLAQSMLWYDFSVSVDGWRQRHAGRMENGRDGVSDPAMGTAVQAAA